MFADILNDCVMCVELLAPGLPRPLVMPTLCGAGLGRSLVGVAGGGGWPRRVVAGVSEPPRAPDRYRSKTARP